MPASDLQKIVAEKIKNLRPKLLDLSRRNPLISTRLSPRSSSHIRVVDELPDVLFFNLNSNQAMRLVPLPEIDVDPLDENTKFFRDAASNARLTDETYLNALDAVDRDAEDYLDIARQLERQLKDRIRDEFGLPKRQAGSEINLAQHAKNNHITPSYDLPEPDAASDDRHQDNDIQTLFLPKELERKLDAISAKCRTWMQETGINVLQIAYGFLEWSEPNQNGTSFAPLILSTARLEKRRTRQGSEFWVQGAGEDAVLNGVMQEKLRQFGIELPPFDGSSIESYLAAVAEIAPKTITTWKARRQIAIGVFPSARMAMFHDLDPTHKALHESEIVSSLLTGSNIDAENPFGDEYSIDEPHIESAVPNLVMDADSSQFSALVDIAQGKNLAVEGPPGTGKSQTIVNAIASALASGKKVLFVAEKLAALNVVKSRLDAIGLGEFLLPLQAERSTREQVIASIRERIEMDRPAEVKDYESEVAQFKRARSELAEYISLVTAPFGNSGFTVHEILGKAIACSRFDDVGGSVFGSCSIPELYLTKAGMLRLREMAADAATAHAASTLAAQYWKSTRLKTPNRFVVDDACELAKHAGAAFSVFGSAHRRLSKFDIPNDMTVAEMDRLATYLTDVDALADDDAAAVLAPLLVSSSAPVLEEFTSDCLRLRSLSQDLSEVFAFEPCDEVLYAVNRIAALCSALQFETLDAAKLGDLLNNWTQWLTHQNKLLSDLSPLVAEAAGADSWLLADVETAYRAITAAGSTALLYRNDVAAEPGATSLLRRFCGEGRQLSQERERWEDEAPLALDNSIETLTDWLTTIRASGALSFLSTNYRQTKRQAVSAFNSQGFDKPALCSNIERLLAFKKREVSFSNNSQVSAVFGRHFAGTSSDFASFERLADFYDNVNANLNGPQSKPVRQSLRTAPIDVLSLYPSTAGRPDPSAFGVATFANLRGYVAQAQARCEEMKVGIEELEQLARVFKLPSEIAVANFGHLVRQVEAYINLTRALDGNADASALLGERFRGHKTDGSRLEKVCKLLLDEKPLANLVSALIVQGATTSAREELAQVVEAAAAADSALTKLCNVAQMSPEHYLSKGDPLQIAEFLNASASDREGLLLHAAVSPHMDRLVECGVAPLAAHLSATAGNLDDLEGIVEAAAMRSLAKALHGEHDRKLTKFSGTTLDRLRATLAHKDREIIKASRRVLRQRIHTRSKPPRGISTGKKSSWTQKALLDNEIAKQQRFISVRDLTARAGEALQELKPCWMMSPLAVAQYIPKGTLQFDLCIIDEASQMPPEAAIGALLRARQVMVVGDTNQLPPSSFFRTVLDDEDADEDDTVLNESVLEMANATFRPARRLRWHYRSRHSGLIAFSNRLVYDDNLVVFPSASEAATNMGVEYRRVDGLYKAGTNPIEARVVVDAILSFMRSDMNRSLGVVTLNQRQRDLIREEFEYALTTDTAAQSYVDTWREKNDGLEEFFVKNLENVQGDERDVIFIATVYGPESFGAKVHQRFGPINGMAGKRRLNVLFSRAKQKIVTFSSMTSADIVAEEDGNVGAYMLKRWLDYSATGQLDAGTRTTREPDSDFEVFVSQQIRAMGLEPVHQVGAAGYFIDIGVRHPDWPYGYVLGVECDGASYHSAKSARDRDRLRQEVLEGLGWKLHRIWSTDWFNNPRLEAERLRTVVSQRMQVLKSQEQSFRSTPTNLNEQEYEDEDSAIEPPLRLPTATIVRALMTEAQVSKYIEPGDTVRIRYLDNDTVLQFTIHDGSNEPDHGFLNKDLQLAKAVLGAEIDDEIEVLIGSYVRKFVVEAVTKAGEREMA